LRKTGLLLVFLLTLISLTAAPVLADPVTVSVQEDTFNFDTGDGRDGDVEIRQKPGEPGIVELLINGTVVSTSMAETTVVSTGGSQYLTTTLTYQDLYSNAWTAGAGRVITQAHWCGNTRASYHHGYLYAWVDGAWQQVAQNNGTWDTWVTLPAGTTQVRTRLTTDSRAPVAETFIDVSEVTTAVSTEGSQRLTTTLTYQDLYGDPWNVLPGNTMTEVHWCGNTRASYHLGYLYALVNGTWQQVASRSGTWDELVTLPAGTTQVRTRLTTDSRAPVAGTLVDIPGIVIRQDKQTIYARELELDGRALGERSDRVYSVIKLENIAPYLPETKTYAPSLTTAFAANGLYLSAADPNTDQESDPFLLPEGYLPPFQAHIEANVRVGGYYYLYSFVDGAWQEVVKNYGVGVDTWVTLPAGTTQIKTRLVTGASVSPPTYIDVPEVKGIFNSKTKAPADIGTAPQFNSLTVGPGVILTSESDLMFRARTLTVEGLILGRHGDGGPAVSPTTLNGGDGKNIVILAGTVTIAPGGTTGENGAIMAGWGGGGGAYQSFIGNGGQGGSLWLYADELTNRGEIRSGNGGGGAAYEDRNSGRAATGNRAGDTLVVANTVYGGGVIASGYSGADGGTCGFHSSASPGYGGGGRSVYDTIGGKWTNQAGSTGGMHANTGFAGMWGGEGGNSPGVSRPDGDLIIKTNKLVEVPGISPKFLVGYTQGGWFSSICSYASSTATGAWNNKTIWIERIDGDPALTISGGMYLPRDYNMRLNTFSVTDDIRIGTAASPVNVTLASVWLATLNITGNATFTGDVCFTPGITTISGAATFAPSSYIYANSKKPSRFSADSIIVSGEIGETRGRDLTYGMGCGGGD
jgi:hypothetical protein